MNIPSSWAGMTFFNRMAYLVDTKQAKNFKDAMTKLRKPRQPAKVMDVAARLPYKDET